MKKKIYIIPLVIFSLLLIGAKPLKSFNSPTFFDLSEQAIIESDAFIENGVKINYCSKTDIEIEYERLLKEFQDKCIDNVEITNNKIIYKDSNSDITVVLWEENNETMVEIVVINNNPLMGSLLLKRNLEKLLNNNSTKEKYFSYVKGKIELQSYEKIEETIMNSIKKDTLEVLNIHNGYSATAEFRDSQRVNMGYMEYDSGRQIIIGTPIIFVTY